MTEKPLWDARKSATLSIIVAWVALVGGVAVAALLVPILNYARTPPGTIFDEAFAVRAVGPLYACLAFGIAALIILLPLLRDIRRGDVFTTPNVRRLRLISYCGFAIAISSVVAAILTPPRLLFLALAAVAGFLGLLMRVIKNAIDTARLLKEDADFTI